MIYILFLACILFIVYFVSKAYHKAVFQNVTVKRYFSKHRVFEGEELELTYEIKNNKFLPIIGMRIIDEMPPTISVLKKTSYQRMNFFSVSVMGYEKVTRTYKIKAYGRDFLQVKTLTLCCKDIFGMMETYRQINTYDQLFIYPRSHAMETKLLHKLIKECKLHKKSYEEDPESFHSIRNYVTSDSMRRINWNKTSQYGELMTNEYEMPQNKKINLFIDLTLENNNILRNHDVILEGLISQASYSMDYLLKRDFEVGLYVNGRYKDTGMHTHGLSFVHVPARKGEKQKYKILDALASLQIHSIMKMEHVIQNKRKELSESIVLYYCTSSNFFNKMNVSFKHNQIKAYTAVILSDQEKMEEAV